jgi:hypothetical protein
MMSDRQKAREIVGNYLANQCGLRTSNASLTRISDELAFEVNKDMGLIGAFTNIRGGTCPGTIRFQVSEPVS